MTEAETAFELESDAAKIADLFPRLIAACQASGLDEMAAFQLTSAVVEAVNNSIAHAYSGESGHLIRIRCRCVEDNLEIEIRDRGRALPADLLDGAAMPSPDADSGRGWPIIREWTDSARYARIDDENVLNLRRRLQR